MGFAMRWRAAIEVNSRKRSEWSIVSGIAWGLAIWISAYESLVLFFITMVVSVLEDRKAIFAKYRRIGWSCFVADRCNRPSNRATHSGDVDLSIE